MRYKHWYCVILLIGCYSLSWSQDALLAKQYLDQAKFKKAYALYEVLATKNPNSSSYFENKVYCLQQLKEFDKAEKVINKKLNKNKYSSMLLVVKGHNYQLQEEEEKAEQYYKRAIDHIDDSPSIAYNLGKKFEEYFLLKKAIQTYKKAIDINPNFNFNYKIGTIYGQLEQYEDMFVYFLDYLERTPNSKTNLLVVMKDFISEDPNNSNNIILKKELLIRNQKQPNTLWNEILAWLFFNQHQYQLAFSQYKAIYNRDSSQSSLYNIIELAKITENSGDTDSTIRICDYIIKQAPNKYIKITAQLILNKVLHRGAKLDKINKDYLGLIEKYGEDYQTIDLLIAYAKFLNYKLSAPEKAIELLKKTIDLSINKRKTATIKLLLGDMLVYLGKYNQAIIYYTKVQREFENDPVGQKAQFKIAQTSFYKGDFKWAESQLDILKSSTSQLIANDALQLKWLITDNSLEDTTFNILKKYAKASLLFVQQKPTQAIRALNSLLIQHKGSSIEDEALYKQAEIFKSIGDTSRAITNYKKIIQYYNNDILSDDALFELAKIYDTTLHDKDLAFQYYENIVLKHPNSVYFYESRKRYREMRNQKKQENQI